VSGGDGSQARRAGWAIGAGVAALAGLALLVGWAIARGPRRGGRGATSAADSPLAGGQPVPAVGGTRLSEVTNLVRGARGNPGPLIAAFAAWAGDPQAQEARRILLAALATEPQPLVRLATISAAVEATPLAWGKDPLQREIVGALSSVWNGDLVRKGRDLLFAEARPKVRQAVTASFVELALSDRAAALDPSQRSGLTSDFIDLYRQASPDQRGDVLAVVRRLGGSDVAELLAGNGLGVDSRLGRHLEYQRALEAARRATRDAAGP
jgi:hypothetical protein